MIKKVRKFSLEMREVTGVQTAVRMTNLPEAVSTRPIDVEVVVTNQIEVAAWDDQCDKALELFTRTDFKDPVLRVDVILNLIEKILFCGKTDSFMVRFFQNQAIVRTLSLEFLLKIAPQFVVALFSQCFGDETSGEEGNASRQDWGATFASDLTTIISPLSFEILISCLVASSPRRSRVSAPFERLLAQVAGCPQTLQLSFLPFFEWIRFLDQKLRKPFSEGFISQLTESYFGTKGIENLSKFISEIILMDHWDSEEELAFYCGFFQALAKKCLAESIQKLRINEPLLAKLIKAVLKIKGVLTQKEFGPGKFMEGIDFGKILNLGLHLEICFKSPSQWLFYPFIEELTHFVKDKDIFCRDFVVLHLTRRLSPRKYPDEGLVEYKIEEIFGSNLLSGVQIDQQPKIGPQNQRQGISAFFGVNKEHIVGTFLGSAFVEKSAYLISEDPLRQFQRAFLVT
jgi:hypothetical protein